MSQNGFSSGAFTEQQIHELILKHYGLQGSLHQLPGEVDLNIKIQTSSEAYLLKISQLDADRAHIEFQRDLLNHLQKTDLISKTPALIQNKQSDYLSIIEDSTGDQRIMTLLSWMEGRIFSSVNPHKEPLLYSIGQHAGSLTSALKDFDHPYAHRTFEWDLAQASWTFDHLGLFSLERQKLVLHFQKRFQALESILKSLRKSIIHNDVNDFNIVVSDDLIHPQVESIIDFGDAIHASTINDLAITIAYAVMNKPDPLRATIPIVEGYHSQFPLKEEELECLHTLVGIRLVISVTKSALNKQLHPENEYLLISEQSAWDLLTKWHAINERFATYSLRNACGFTPNPDQKAFEDWLEKRSFKLRDVFPENDITHAIPVDMSVDSTWLGSRSEYQNDDLTSFRLNQLQKANPGGVIMDGYLEVRPLYTSDIFKFESNHGPEYRSMHLGVDFWLDAGTPIHSLFDGTVFSIHDNAGDKNYGPTLILEHKTEAFTFYSLYGHLSKTTLDHVEKGQKIKKGELIAWLGDYAENGNWTPHLHFQLILDMLGNEVDFYGVGNVRERAIWSSLCPDPNLLFEETKASQRSSISDDELLNFRKEHLGKGMSLSYETPLHMVRGDGAYLIDKTGRKYLDTVNNVAHVGHEHPRVVEKGQQQMATLNTNTRYLHNAITTFAQELLDTFPECLSVVHFVNSGSEANELALRMAKTHTGQRDFIAMEVGYHGNTNATVDVSSYKFDGKGGSGIPEHTHLVPLPDTFRGLYQGDDAGASYASHVQQHIDQLKEKGEGMAGFISESILSCGGQIELPEGFLQKAYSMTREAGGVCIADEVQTGLGRVGSHFWAFELHNVIPDIVTIGKPLGNGHPVAAVVCTRKIADSFANGMEYFNTFGGNPVSSVIGTEVLRVIKDERLQKHAEEIGAYLKSGFRDLQSEFPIIGDIRGQGLFLGFELVDENKNPLPEHASYLANRMKEFAILMSTDGPDHNVLKIKPPMVFSKEHADELLLRLATVFREDFMKL